MLQKNIVSFKDLELLSELTEEIRKYQGIGGSAESWFGIEDNFIENIESNTLNIIRDPKWVLLTGRTNDYDFKIYKFKNILKIEKRSKESDINIIKFVDNNSNVRTNSTILNYKVNNNPFLKTRNITGRGNATLLCDCDGNFICEQTFWDSHENTKVNEAHNPYVRYQDLQAIDSKFILAKNHKYYYNGIQPDISFGKYIIRKIADSEKTIEFCGYIDEETYYKLLEGTPTLEKDKTPKIKRKLKDRIFKHKA